MPFIQQTPRPFTRQDIEGLNINQKGVYGLFKQNAWVYIGKGDIRQRLQIILMVIIPALLVSGQRIGLRR